MIWIVFPGGGFGTTLEYAIHQFTEEFQKSTVDIHANGSMHTYHKECHPTSEAELQNIKPGVKIVTPVYPNFTHSTVRETITNIKKYIAPGDSVVFVYSDSNDAVERTDVFQFYKINIGNSQFKNAINNIKQWNSEYTCFDDMQPWEKRELISLRYQTIVPQHNNILELADSAWLSITTDELLNDIETGIKTVIEFLGLQVNNTGLAEFAQEWRNKQQYMLDDIDTALLIVEHTINGVDYNWPKLNLQIEALIQYQLRNKGFEIQCNDLNEFSTNSLKLKELLI